MEEKGRGVLGVNVNICRMLLILQTSIIYYYYLYYITQLIFGIRPMLLFEIIQKVEMGLK